MATVLPFQPQMRPVPFRGRFPGFGPADDEACPCGSNRQARRCHWDRNRQRWLLPAYQPRRIKHRTGVRRDGCYANVSNDCGETQPNRPLGKLSNEHWLSAGILEDSSDGKFVHIGELPFQESGRIDKRTPKSLGARNLCVDHNSSLSDFDKTAQAMLRTLEIFYTDQAGSGGDYDNQFDLFNGEEIERWMLKMVWGASEAYPTTPKIRGDQRRHQLAEYLFRNGNLPIGWGLYGVGARTGRHVDPDHAITVKLEERGGELRSGSLDVGGVRLTFAIGARTSSAETEAIHRPSLIVLDRAGTHRHKVVAFSWDDTSDARGKQLRVTYFPN